MKEYNREFGHVLKLLRTGEEILKKLFGGWRVACFILLGSNILAMSLPAQVRSPAEALLRERLGIPAEAGEVIIFAQSSHVDPDWLLTSDQYQRLLTDKTFDRALIELAKDPRYIYSVECTFFFKRYWDSHPEKQAELRKLVNEGRIKFTATGITSPDSLLPEPENLIRDYLTGLKWLNQNGINPEPLAASFADCFGHSPSLPAILRELGYKYTAFSRIDGMYFIATDLRSAKAFPFKGSSAELLLQKLRTLDFIWQGPDRSEVIAHWNAFTYFQGDLIDYAGVVHTYGIHAGIPARSAKSTNAKIDSYIAQLRPLSKTGYMFCPIGGDFNPPVKNLRAILDNYNRDCYPGSGVYAVLASLEDYMALVEFHKDKLPLLALDPNPLFMGFYASRPELKQRGRKLGRDLVLAEKLGVLAEQKGLASYPDLSLPWEIAGFSDHHDFITGTAPDRVYWKEQIPVLKHAQQEVDQALANLASQLAAPASINPPAIKWEQTGRILKVENDFYLVEIDAAKGGCITRWMDKSTGRELISGPSNDVIYYYDSGGLWRMGHELNRGKFQAKARASDHKAELDVQEQNGVLRVSATLEMQGRPLVRTCYFRADQSAVRMKLKGALKPRITATLCFRTSVTPGKFVQEIPYGVIERPLQKNFAPTFWAVKNWVELEDQSKNFRVYLALTAPAAVHAGASGTLEMVALRNARQEKIMGLPLLAFPASGSDPDTHEIDYAFWTAGHGDWREQRAWALAGNALSDSWIDPSLPDLEKIAASLVKTDRRDVLVTAVKKAENGNGVVVRLFSYAPGPVKVHLDWQGKAVQKAVLADGLEHEKAVLPLKDGVVELEMPYSLATVILLF